VRRIDGYQSVGGSIKEDGKGKGTQDSSESPPSSELYVRNSGKKKGEKKKRGAASLAIRDEE